MENLEAMQEKSDDWKINNCLPKMVFSSGAWIPAKEYIATNLGLKTETVYQILTGRKNYTSEARKDAVRNLALDLIRQYNKEFLDSE